LLGPVPGERLKSVALWHARLRRYAGVPHRPAPAATVRGWQFAIIRSLNRSEITIACLPFAVFAAICCVAECEYTLLDVDEDGAACVRAWRFSGCSMSEVGPTKEASFRSPGAA